ncbi:evolutionarily conserved signaling intermediate in Toll pathway, mitochondrial isoform X2 [Rhinatrema bivittatum]|uniref:evolutionarily conserved signaling intermediate in Toll pathway, mitochondrial isoform X2 n=1 Tax=Rhinatrema bivittatum TaxID=194408 RepID=UPI001128288F|nr:evolutionarily conserved signaling intermediate in Toll pathway, mitochondrial isoform X2 [Rhinatrema bivittatum]XP_029440983.1 evolutionarily conserved signaling intermediate in Toll pathway, mitochondrial isoform X2 [Rhinatrema bivittatum]
MRSTRLLLRLAAEACGGLLAPGRARGPRETISWAQTSRPCASRGFRTGARGPSSKPAPPGRGPGWEARPEEKSLVTYEDFFDQVGRDGRSKAAFGQVLAAFCGRDVRRRGHVDFIYAALRKMPEFGVERDLRVYNALLDVFPKEVFVAQNAYQRMFNHYPRQQECGVQVLEQMETYGILPDAQTKFLLLQVFGQRSHPFLKYRRLMYWFPKFRNLNPFPVPKPLPRDPTDVARLSLRRMAADLDARITVYQMPSVDEEMGLKLPYIVGVQSPDQQSLLRRHNPDRPVYVEGPFPLWLKTTCVYYYILRAELPPPGEKEEEVVDAERNFYYPMQLDLDLERDLGDDDSFDVDEVEEGPVFAMCMAGAGDQATLAKWICGLQETNPALGRIPVVFRLDPGPHELQAGTEAEETPEEEAVHSREMKL